MTSLRRLGLLLVMVCGLARADESVDVCFNFGCASAQTVIFPETRLVWAQEFLAAAGTPAQERRLLSQVIGRLYVWAGEQSPIAADRAGNYEDGGVPGGMDCIDHATTTTRFLALLERRAALRFHRVLAPAHRGVFFEHYSAQIEETGSGLLSAETGQVRRFAVDTWYVDNGRPAPVMPVESWEEGNDPI